VNPKVEGIAASFWAFQEYAVASCLCCSFGMMVAASDLITALRCLGVVLNQVLLNAHRDATRRW
jgi:hypothetical protein